VKIIFPKELKTELKADDFDSVAIQKSLNNFLEIILSDHSSNTDILFVPLPPMKDNNSMSLPQYLEENMTQNVKGIVFSTYENTIRGDYPDSPFENTLFVRDCFKNSTYSVTCNHLDILDKLKELEALVKKDSLSWHGRSRNFNKLYQLPIITKRKLKTDPFLKRIPDDPALSGTDLSKEFVRAAELYYKNVKNNGQEYLSKWEVLTIIKSGFKSAFLDRHDKEHLLRDVEEELYQKIILDEGIEIEYDMDKEKVLEG